MSFVRPILVLCSTVSNPYIPSGHSLGLNITYIERVQGTSLEGCNVDTNFIAVMSIIFYANIKFLNL